MLPEQGAAEACALTGVADTGWWRESLRREDLE
jgi:hypothetical protein